MLWTLHLIHRSQFMGEMGLLLLTCLLLLQFRIQVLLFTLIHLLPLIIHFLLTLLCLQHLQLTFLFHLLLLLALSASDAPEISGCQNNGPFQIATSCQGNPHQQLPLQMKRTLALMIPWTSSRLVQHPLLSPRPTGSPNNAPTQICGTQHVRKRWRLTDSMALGRLSNCLLGSMPWVPDGS
jgi:hypothetical protein